QRTEMTFVDRGWASDCPLPLFGRNADGSYGADDYIDPTTGQPKCWTIDNGGVTINTLGTAWLPGQAGLGSLGYYGTYFPDEMPAGLDYFNRWRPNAAVTAGLPGYEGVDYYGRDGYDPEMKRQSLISPTKNYTGFLQAGYDLHALGDAELYFEGLVHRRESRQNGYLQHAMDYPAGSPLLGDLIGLPAFMAAPAD